MVDIYKKETSGRAGTRNASDKNMSDLLIIQSASLKAFLRLWSLSSVPHSCVALLGLFVQIGGGQSFMFSSFYILIVFNDIVQRIPPAASY